MNIDSTLISFIIPVKQPADLNTKGLQSVLRQNIPGYSKEVIIVNNSPENLECSEKDVTVVQELRKGPQFARNKGLSVARGRFVAFIDCDVILEENWLDEMMSALKTGEFWGAQSSLITTATGTQVFGRFRKLSSLLSFDGMIMAQHFFPVINTSACIFDRARTGFFTFHNSFNKCEDVELSWRLYRRASCSWIYVSDAKAYCYYHPEEFGAFFRRNFHLGRYYGGLVGIYREKYSSIKEWHDSRFFNSLNELGRLYKKSPSVAVLMRVAMSLSYWLGFYLSPKKIPDYKVPDLDQPHRRLTMLKRLTLIHDLQNGSVQTRRAL